MRSRILEAHQVRAGDVVQVGCRGAWYTVTHVSEPRDGKVSHTLDFGPSIVLDTWMIVNVQGMGKDYVNPWDDGHKSKVEQFRMERRNSRAPWSERYHNLEQWDALNLCLDGCADELKVGYSAAMRALRKIRSDLEEYRIACHNRAFKNIDDACFAGAMAASGCIGEVKNVNNVIQTVRNKAVTDSRSRYPSYYRAGQTIPD